MFDDPSDPIPRRNEGADYLDRLQAEKARPVVYPADPDPSHLPFDRDKYTSYYKSFQTKDLSTATAELERATRLWPDGSPVIVAFPFGPDNVVYGMMHLKAAAGMIQLGTGIHIVAGPL